jgi:hypothetical protein
MERKVIMFHTEIRIKGKLEPNWSDWFEEMKVQVNSSGDTILAGDLVDKSAVYGIISRLSSLGFTLVSVTCDEINITSPPES